MEIMPNANFKKGDIIFREGDQADGVYYICNGRVKISKHIKDQALVLTELEDGDIFGELAMIDSRPRAATVTALEDTWVYKFSAKTFESRMGQTDELMKTIIMTLVLTIRNLNIKQERLMEKWGFPKIDDHS